MRRLLLLLTLALLGGCATHTRETNLQTTLDGYGAALRWGDFKSALRYVDPEVLKADPPSSLQMARYAQVRVSLYDVKATEALDDTTVTQVVEIGLINRHTQHERRILDHQTWKYNPQTERWWLESGLPKIVGD